EAQNPGDDPDAGGNDCGGGLSDWKYSPTFRDERIGVFHLCAERRSNCPIIACSGSLVYQLKIRGASLLSTSPLITFAYYEFYLRSITDIYQKYFIENRLFRKGRRHCCQGAVVS